MYGGEGGGGGGKGREGEGEGTAEIRGNPGKVKANIHVYQI